MASDLHADQPSMTQLFKNLLPLFITIYYCSFPIYMYFYFILFLYFICEQVACD